MRVEDLGGIIGRFEGEIKDHPDQKLRRRLAYGLLTYMRVIAGASQQVSIPIEGIRVRGMRNPDHKDYDFRRYIRVRKGPRGNHDTIIGLIDRK